MPAPRATPINKYPMIGRRLPQALENASFSFRFSGHARLFSPGSSFPPFLFPFHLPFFLPGWPGWIIPSAVSPIVVSRVAVLRAAVFRTASGTAAPVLRRHYLCRPVCPARCVHGFCCPDAIPLACLFSGCRVPDARRLPVCSPGGGRRLPWFFARAGRCVFRAGEPWDPG